MRRHHDFEPSSVHRPARSGCVAVIPDTAPKRIEIAVATG